MNDENSIYMSPAYAMNGLFSENSDVFSFGFMIQEILSGKKNVSFHQPNAFSSLLEYLRTQLSYACSFL